MNPKYFAEGIYRGEMPTDYADLLRMSDRGITTWLHLESGVQRLLPGSWAEGAVDWQAKLRNLYLYAPMWNFSFPRKDQLDWCVDQIDRHRMPGIYVCCKHGKDRTGITLAYWRVKSCAWTPERAWKEAQEFGMHTFYRLLGWEKKFYDLCK